MLAWAFGAGNFWGWEGAGGSGGLHHYTFPPGSSTWTCPAGVTSLVSATGSGANGSGGAWVLSNIGSVSVSSVGGPVTNTGQTWQSVQNGIDNIIAAVSSPVGTPKTTSYYELGFSIDPANNSAYTLSTFAGYTVQGQAYASTPNVPYPLTSPLTYGQGLGVNIWTQIYQGPSSGAATDGFGEVFPGGASGESAPSTTFTNIAVTPGNTYTVTNNGSLTISY